MRRGKNILICVVIMIFYCCAGCGNTAGNKEIVPDGEQREETDTAVPAQTDGNGNDETPAKEQEKEQDAERQTYWEIQVGGETIALKDHVPGKSLRLALLQKDGEKPLIVWIKGEDYAAPENITAKTFEDVGDGDGFYIYIHYKNEDSIDYYVLAGEKLELVQEVPEREPETERKITMEKSEPPADIDEAYEMLMNGTFPLDYVNEEDLKSYDYFPKPDDNHQGSNWEHPWKRADLNKDGVEELIYGYWNGSSEYAIMYIFAYDEQKTELSVVYEDTVYLGAYIFLTPSGNLVDFSYYYGTMEWEGYTAGHFTKNWEWTPEYQLSVSLIYDMEEAGREWCVEHGYEREDFYFTKYTPAANESYKESAANGTLQKESLTYGEMAKEIESLTGEWFEHCCSDVLRQDYLEKLGYTPLGEPAQYSAGKNGNPYLNKVWSQDKAGNSGMNPFSFMITRMEGEEIAGYLDDGPLHYVGYYSGESIKDSCAYRFEGTLQSEGEKAICTVFHKEEEVGRLWLTFTSERCITASMVQFSPGDDWYRDVEINKDYVFTPYHLREEVHNDGFVETLRLETDMDFQKNVTVRVGTEHYGVIRPRVVLTDEWGDTLYAFRVRYGTRPLRAYVGDANGDGYTDIMIDVAFSEIDYPGRAAEKYIFCGKGDGWFETKPLVRPVGGRTEWKELSAVKEEDRWKVFGELAEAEEEEGKEPAYADWSSAYLAYIQETTGENDKRTFKLIYLNDDDIPELACIGICEADGCQIVNYDEGDYHVTYLYRIGFYYLEKDNLLCSSQGNMDNYYDIVYRIIDGRMTIVAQGFCGALYESPLIWDEDEGPTYVYDWNGQDMSRAEYEKKLRDTIDRTVASSEYDLGKGYDVEEMVEILGKNCK